MVGNLRKEISCRKNISRMRYNDSIMNFQYKPIHSFLTRKKVTKLVQSIYETGLFWTGVVGRLAMVKQWQDLNLKLVWLENLFTNLLSCLWYRFGNLNLVGLWFWLVTFKFYLICDEVNQWLDEIEKFSKIFNEF